MQPVDLLSARDKYLDWVRLKRHPMTLRTHQKYLNEFISHVGNMPLSDLSPVHVLTWSSKFHRCQAVQRMASWCHKEARIIASNPLQGMKLPPTGERTKVLSRGEQLQLMRASSQPFRRFLIGLAETMCRPQELRQFRWSMIRMAGNQLFNAPNLLAGRCFFALKQFKGQDRRKVKVAYRIIPIMPRLGRLLARQWGKGQPLDQFCFLNARGRQWTANATRCRMRNLRALGVLEDDGQGERVVCYTLRHSGATFAASQGVRDLLLAELLGHASTRTTQRYVHLQPEHLQDAMKLIARRRRRPPADPS